jgi:molybdate transport system regulatory protein
LIPTWLAQAIGQLIGTLHEGPSARFLHPVHLARTNAIGPGKADLLQAVDETGSIAEAARQLDMSYRRAWSLVRSLNGAFTDPLIETRKGGSARGSAALTKTGQKVLQLYRGMESAAAAAIIDDIADFRSLLAPPSSDEDR